MDMEQEEVQFLGFCGIYKESCKLIYKLRKILTQITLALILPVSFIFLAQERVSKILYRKIRFNEFELKQWSSTPAHARLSDLVSREWAEYVALKILYFAFVLVFSLLSTSAVVYTVACAYTSREIAFKKVMSVVPRVWKRLTITFICSFITFSLYSAGFVLALFICGDEADSPAVDVVSLVILFLYLMVCLYLAIVWQLASVVSVLEDSYGIKAMLKSMRLIRGKMLDAITISSNLSNLIFTSNIFFEIFVCFSEGLGRSIGFGALSLFLLMIIILLGLVAQTVLYLVCKSYHHENIDKSALSDHLEAVYLGDYLPLMPMNVEMEEF